jgi:hypothetical protein
MPGKRLRRHERGLGERPKTLRARQLVAEVKRDAEPLRRYLPVLDAERPKTRADCEKGPRPCPWVGCKFHLYLEVKESGHLRYNFPDRDLDGLEQTCALDVAETGRHTLEEVGDLVNMGRDALERLEWSARERLEDAAPYLRSFAPDDGDDDKGDF